MIAGPGSCLLLSGVFIRVSRLRLPPSQAIGRLLSKGTRRFSQVAMNTNLSILLDDASGLSLATGITWPRTAFLSLLGPVLEVTYRRYLHGS